MNNERSEGATQGPNIMMESLRAELTEEQFNRVSQRIYAICGINLNEAKTGLVTARLMKRLRALKFSSFEQYLDWVEKDRSGGELTAMVDVLTTNKTSFFRESQHFDFLTDNIVPTLQQKGATLRIWSAGCSSGEEPYTLAIILREALPDFGSSGVRILATDISTAMLRIAKEGIYSEEKLRDVPVDLLHKHFEPIKQETGRVWRVKSEVRSLVRFAQLNLMEEWPMRGPFDVIFCRNVMIYFDKETQRRLVARFARYLPTNGHLFVGHSESLTALSKELSYVLPAVYVKHGA